MDQISYQMALKQQEMDFPHKFNSQFCLNSFTPVVPYSTYLQHKVKIQNTNQFGYNLFDLYQRIKNLNQEQPSPGYDLFQIEKKRKKQKYKKYKRSTNNSHKKFISAIRRLFYAVISTKQKQEFQTKYIKFRSSRTFFFIILAYMRFRFSAKLLNSVRMSFINQMKIKINQYKQEIIRTRNKNLQNFREEEIIDIKYSIKSCNEYLSGNTRQAIECMYKKDKSTVIKRQNYQSSLRSVHMIQKQLDQNPRSPLESPYIQDYAQSSDRWKLQRKAINRQIRLNQTTKFVLQQQQHFGLVNSYRRLEEHFNFNKKQMRLTGDTEECLDDDVLEKRLVFEKVLIYPPFLEAIPYVKYDPFLPPFKYRWESKYKIDVREDFFGYVNYGFPKFYLKYADLSGVFAGSHPFSQQGGRQI